MIIMQANITDGGGLLSYLDPERGGAMSGIGPLDPLSFFFLVGLPMAPGGYRLWKLTTGRDWVSRVCRS